ncbi:MAG: hypothetical protein B7Z53_04100, partial [Rhodospirillales bacterium 12-71-4]
MADDEVDADMRAVAEGIGQRQQGRARDGEGRQVVGAVQRKPELPADDLQRDDDADAGQRQAAGDAAGEMEQDLQRRDLTINAIAKDEAGQLHDPYGGIADIKAKILRHVSP